MIVISPSVHLLLISGSLREGSTNIAVLRTASKLAGDGGTYRKPIAWINASGPAAPTGGADAHDVLRKVLGYVHADIVEAACTRIPLTRNAVGSDGTIIDPTARKRSPSSLVTSPLTMPTDEIAVSPSRLSILRGDVLEDPTEVAEPGGGVQTLGHRR
jgi:hypothetical protein